MTAVFSMPLTVTRGAPLHWECGSDACYCRRVMPAGRILKLSAVIHQSDRAFRESGTAIRRPRTAISNSSSALPAPSNAIRDSSIALPQSSITILDAGSALPDCGSLLLASRIALPQPETTALSMNLKVAGLISNDLRRLVQRQ